MNFVNLECFCCKKFFKKENRIETDLEKESSSTGKNL